MKKLLTLLMMTLIAISANAQAVIAEIDWSQEDAFNYWCSGENGSTAVVGAEGLEINVPAAGENYWNPQTIVLNIPGKPVFENPNSPAILAEDGAYRVIITAKHPAGHLQINLGTYDDGVSLQKDFEVSETADFEDIIVDFSEGWPADCFSNVHVLWQSGALPGFSVIKNVQVIDLKKGENWTIAGDKNLLEADWDATNTKNRMYYLEGEKYILQKTELRLTQGTYHYKVFKDNLTQESYPSSNASLVINEDGVYNVNFTFNSSTKDLSATATKVEVWTIAGDKNLLGSNWDATDKANKMRLSSENFILTKTNLTLPKGVYQYKVFKDYAKSESYPSSNASLRIEEDATFTINFIFNSNTKELSAIATKTDGLFFNYIPKGKVAELIQNPNKYKGTVIIPSSVTHDGQEYTVTKIGDNAFSDCSSLTSVTIPSSVTTIGYSAFNDCSSLKSVTIPNNVSSIGERVFYGCRSLTTLTIPSNVTSIGSSAFSGCSSLTSLTIPSSVTSIGNYAFSACSSLTSVTIPSSVTSIGNNAFNGCKAIRSIDFLPNTISTISDGMFSGCSGLTSVTIPNNVTSIGNSAFSGCSRLTSLSIPNSVTSIGSSAFSSCSSLTSLNIPSNVTAIYDYVFSGCSSLTSITIPNSVMSIGWQAFFGCSGLTSVIIPNSVTSIGSSAFSNCSKLSSITIGEGVSWIYSNAFANCQQLTDVYCLAENVPNTNSDAFSDSYIDYTTLHVPSASLNNYKNAEPWKNFKNKVALSGEDIPETPKCAKPTITYNNGVITFSCETEGVEFISEVKANDNKKEYNNKIILSNTYTVSVYATKTGYDNSETVTMEVIGTGGILGDLTGDGKVDVADHVKLSNIIMNK